jgi:hypothetical protein
MTSNNLLEAILYQAKATIISMDLLEAILMSMDLLEAAMMLADLLKAILNLLDKLEDMLIICRHGGVCLNLGRHVRGRQELHGPVGSHHDLTQRGRGHPTSGEHGGGDPELFQPRGGCILLVWMLSSS